MNLRDDIIMNYFQNKIFLRRVLSCKVAFLQKRVTLPYITRLILPWILFLITAPRPLVKPCGWGVPVITLQGNRHVGRVGASILTQLDLTDLITETEEEYISRGIQLSSNIAQLTGLRSSMRQFMQNSPICDAASFARDVETAYRKMWKNWVLKNTHQKIEVQGSTPKTAKTQVVTNLEGPKSQEAEHYVNMGISLKSQGRLEESLECYKKAISLDSQLSSAYYNMGNVLIGMNRL